MPLLIAVIAVLLLLLLITVAKFNAFLSFVMVCIFVGLTMGLSLDNTIEAVKKGIGDTLGLLVLILGLTAWPGTARFIRGEILSLKEQAFTEAARAIGQVLSGCEVTRTTWLVDRPVSNSGRLGQLLAELASECGWSWEVELVLSPDRDLVAGGGVVATSDSAVLDRCGEWIGLAGEVIRRLVPSAWVLDLGTGGEDD